jgi:hypothetical protein
MYVEMISANVMNVSVILNYYLMMTVILNVTLLNVIMTMILAALYPAALLVLMTN